MPSRKLSSNCRACGGKNPLKSGFCSHCGAKLPEGPPPRDGDGRVRLHADIAHPINAACRDLIQRRVVSEYEAELIRARQPGYVSRYDAMGDEEQRSRG
jgi:stage V sporulation protein G